LGGPNVMKYGEVPDQEFSSILGRDFFSLTLMLFIGERIEIKTF